jgi:hypothetical protein
MHYSDMQSHCISAVFAVKELTSHGHFYHVAAWCLAHATSSTAHKLIALLRIAALCSTCAAWLLSAAHTFESSSLSSLTSSLQAELADDRSLLQSRATSLLLLLILALSETEHRLPRA